MSRITPSTATDEQTIVPAAYTATETGSAVDLAGSDEVTVVFSTGAVANDDFTFSIEVADDDGSGSPDAGTWAAAAAADLVGDVPDAPTANTVTEVGYRGISRHLRVVATDGGSGDATFAVNVRLGKQRVQPA